MPHRTRADNTLRCVALQGRAFPTKVPKAPGEIAVREADLASSRSHCDPVVLRDQRE